MHNQSPDGSVSDGGGDESDGDGLPGREGGDQKDGRRGGGPRGAPFMKQYEDKKHLEHILDEQHYWSDPDDDKENFNVIDVRNSIFIHFDVAICDKMSKNYLRLISSS